MRDDARQEGCPHPCDYAIGKEQQAIHTPLPSAESPASGECGRKHQKKKEGRAYTDNRAELHEARQFLALGAAAPELAGGVIGGDINCAKREFVGLQDRLQACSSGDDMGRPRSQGGVEVEGRVGHGGWIGVGSWWVEMKPSDEEEGRRRR